MGMAGVLVVVLSRRQRQTQPVYENKTLHTIGEPRVLKLNLQRHITSVSFKALTGTLNDTWIKVTIFDTRVANLRDGAT